MATLVIKTNASQGTDVRIGPLVIPNSGGSETVTNTNTIAKLQANAKLRAYVVDDAHGAGSSTLILNNGTSDITQTDALNFLDTVLIPSTGAYSVGVRDSAGAESILAEDLDAGSSLANKVLTSDGDGTVSWQDAPGAGGGEANTASNQGVGGVGFYITKAGTDLQFKNLNAADGSITVANDATNKEVDINVNYATPVSIGTANSQGAAETAAASNHVHDHGSQTTSTHHAVTSSSGAGFAPQSNFAATTAPTATDDSGSGYQAGSRWVDVTNDTAWVCVDATAASAVWRPVAPADNLIKVAKQGGDYTSVKSACDSITDSGSTNPYYIEVAPGEYTEAPFTIPTYVSVFGQNATLKTSNNSADFITLTAFSTLNTFEIHGPTGSGFAAIVGTASASGQLALTISFLVGNIAVHAKANVTLTLHELICSSSVTDFIKASGGGTARLRVFDCFATGTAAFATGTNSEIVIASGEINGATNALYSDDGGDVDFSVIEAIGCTNVVRIGSTGTGGEVDGGALIAKGTTTYDILTEKSTGTVSVSGGLLNQGLFSINTWDNIQLNFLSSTEDAEAFQIMGELHVGLPEQGKESCFGEGDSYVAGMAVLTTDSTATSTTDGGNLTDVSTAAGSASGSTFTFQGTAANHTILFGSEKVDAGGSGTLKHWGIKFKQTTAAVEATAKSFVFEIWDGTNWTAIGVMATHSSLSHRYANEVFIRANLSEHVRYGVDTSTTWARKTISSKNLYWSRVRITTGLTTAPVFEQAKLSTSRFEANSDGTNTYHGLSRFKTSVTLGGNIFGEEGGVTDGSFSVGTGGAPTGWSHNLKNCVLNGDGDAIHFQTIIPQGTDTSFPIHIEMVYIREQGTGNTIQAVASMKPQEIAGVLEADPTGGVTPVARTVANTSTLTNEAAQTDTDTALDTSDSTKLRLKEWGPFDISDYYGGDLLLCRIELDDGGAGAGTDIAVWTVDILGTRWTHGGKL